MKKSVLSLLCILIFVGSMNSQEKEHIVKIFPAGFINKFKVSYENPIHEDITWGGLFSMYYGGPNNDYKGYKIEPAIRFYTGKTPGLGLYLQLKAGGGFFQKNQTIYFIEHVSGPDGTPIDYNETYQYRDQNFISFGGGLALGVQFAMNKKKTFLVNFELGFQYYSENEEYRREYSYTEDDGTKHNIIETDNPPYHHSMIPDWYGLGPGAIINPTFAIGYRF